MFSYSGVFVALEGIDGSGKTTQIKRVASVLKEKGIEVYVTSEPSKGRLGPVLRQYLSDKTSHFATDALLFAADRVEHFHHEILPQLQQGKIVITDRYKTSSIIYQGSTHLSDEWIRMINNQVPDADVTFYFRISADVAMDRLSDADRSHLEKFETVEKLQQLLSRYEMVEIPNRYNLDAEKSEDLITQDMAEIILDHLS